MFYGTYLDNKQQADYEGITEEGKSIVYDFYNLEV